MVVYILVKFEIDLNERMLNLWVVQIYMIFNWKMKKVIYGNVLVSVLVYLKFVF